MGKWSVGKSPAHGMKEQSKGHTTQLSLKPTEARAAQEEPPATITFSSFSTPESPPAPPPPCAAGLAGATGTASGSEVLKTFNMLKHTFNPGLGR